MQELKISIITVCLNAESTIEKTIKSVLEQDYPNVEYIVIDGASTDNTISLIKKHQSHISKVISEPDNGIYSAMNKGIDMATGDFIFFLNANDAFYNEKVISSIFSKFTEDKESEIIYGDIITVDKKSNTKNINRFSKVSKRFLIRNTICHQAIFAKTELFRKYGLFNTRYKIAADYDWILRMLITHRIKSRYIQEIISYFSLDGVSAKEHYKKMASLEHKEIATRFFGPMAVGFDSLIVFALRLGSKIKKVFIK
jgi:glycosyltransferase involved in cell wall biosynthesis